MRSDAWNPHSTDKVHKVDVRAFTSRPLELSILRHMRMMGVLNPSTEGGHDYTTRSNNKRMHQPRLSSEDHGANELHLSWLLGLSHKTWKNFSNTAPFHLSKGVGSGDFQLSPSIVSGVALGRCRHFYSVITFSHSHFQRNQAMWKWRRGETFRMRAHLSRYSSPEEPRCLFISVRGSGSTSRRALSRFAYVS